MGELTVGREMDEAVSRIVGWSASDPSFNQFAADGTVRLMRPSTSDADALAAGDVVRAMHKGWGWEIIQDDLGSTVTFYDDDLQTILISAAYPTRAEAICRAITALVDGSHATKKT